MNLYAFELGRKKELCFGELIAVLGEDKLVERNLDTAIFKLNNIDGLQDRLGGTIKIIEIFDHVPKTQISTSIEKKLKQFFQNHSGKIPFSISVLSFKDRKTINIKELLNFSKKIIKSLGLNCRFVNKGPISPKPSTIYKARVIEKGIDICIINGQSSSVYLGRTITIQNIDSYSKRDFDKPGRDAKVGMTPPKLAQIMINLAGPSNTIYDPFCGTGTFLMEAMLMGKNGVGSDISTRMVEYSEKNLSWTQEQFRADTKFRIFEKDARFLIKSNIPEKIDAIVTEGYLGKPLEKQPTQHEQETIFRELANLHLNWLRAVRQITNCPIVMCVAAFKVGPQIIHLPKFQELVKEAGYKVTETFTYDRPDQIVVRDIKILNSC
ncbi:MAG: hypothetical protein O3B47_01155 [bacterium]|nr:hypothetical protein [bacterium]